MRIRILAVSTLFLFLSGCVAYALVPAGVTSVGALQVNADNGYNLAPSVHAFGLRKDSQMWTKDGRLLDQLVIIPGVAAGETLLKLPAKTAALPEFRADMLPNEIEELAESTFVKFYGEGNAAIETANLRPHRFGEHRGFMFDVQASITEAPDQKGTVGAFVANEKLYMLFFMASTPYYHDKHAAAAVEVIKSARLAGG